MLKPSISLGEKRCQSMAAGASRAAVRALIHWDFQAQSSLEFNRERSEKDRVWECQFSGKNSLLMAKSETKGQMGSR